MTMHLDNRLSSIRTKKPKGTKMTKSRREQLERDLKLKNKALRQRGEQQWTFNQYVNWLTGKTPKYKTNPNATFSWSANSSYRAGADQTAKIRSRESEPGGTCALPETKKYTGTLVKGISQTHKSNAVPVINEQEILDIARMRR